MTSKQMSMSVSSRYTSLRRRYSSPAEVMTVWSLRRHILAVAKDLQYSKVVFEQLFDAVRARAGNGFQPSGNPERGQQASKLSFLVS